MRRFRAPRWLPGGHLQTIWPALFGRRWAAPEAAHPLGGRPTQGVGLGALFGRRVLGPRPVYQRERWTTPDGDFVDVDFRLAAGHAGDAPWLVLFHGLEGSSRSHYAEAFADVAHHLGWHFAVPHFRGCSGELNLAPRAYHSGDFEEIGWMLARLRERAGRPLHAVGVSLGGNALLRWAEEAGDSAAATVHAVAAVCSPVDLAAGGHAIGRGFNRQVYTRMFLRSMKPKALAKWAQHPGLFDRAQLLAARDLYTFDNLFTAPLHGFRGTDDYWARASAKPQLARIRVPALVLNARNDPFVPAASLPRPGEVGPFVHLWQPPHGGHVGFPAGQFPSHVRAMPAAVVDWLQSMAPTPPLGAAPRGGSRSGPAEPDPRTPLDDGGTACANHSPVNRRKE